MTVPELLKKGLGVSRESTLDKLATNIDIIKSSQELPDDYWPGAFSENCRKPKN